MKKIMPLIIAAAVLTACGHTDMPRSAETEETTVTFGEEAQLIVNPDFRNICWEFDQYSVQRQEQRYCSSSDDNTLYYDDMEFAGFSAKLAYNFEYSKCHSAEYTIVRSNETAAADLEIISHYLNELYACPEEDTSEMPIMRKTHSADIALYTVTGDDKTVIHILFSMPNGYHDRFEYSHRDFEQSTE